MEPAGSPIHLFGTATSDTDCCVTPEQQHRFMQGYDEQHHPALWDEEGLAGSGAIRSTAGDPLKYLQANLHPEGFGGALSEALAMAHHPRPPVLPRTRIALARYLNVAGWHVVACRRHARVHQLCVLPSEVRHHRRYAVRVL